MPGFALLAPVPKIHLDGAVEVLKHHDFAALGSDAFEVFAKTDLGAKVLIYVSHEAADPVVSFEGVYGGYESDSMKMRQLEKGGCRPPSTADDTKWAGYWKVSGLKPLSVPIRLSQIQLPSGRYLDRVFIPRGPLLVLG